MTSIGDRVLALDWSAIGDNLDELGYALTKPLLTAGECAELVALYEDDGRFGSRIDMRRFGFGSGEYKYLARPLPAVVEDLRASFYAQLAPIASRWTERLGDKPFPGSLQAFLTTCAEHGQTKPTPLILRYRAGDYNCLHQDLYGDVAFPIQLTFVLSRRDIDYSGGEFLLTEQRPRAQTRGHAITLERGQAVIFATRYRPAKGSRGYYRVNMRHGVSTLVTGERYTLGIIFHDAR